MPIDITPKYNNPEIQTDNKGAWATKANKPPLIRVAAMKA
jgi:hypothetical protein